MSELAEDPTMLAGHSGRGRSVAVVLLKLAIGAALLGFVVLATDFSEVTQRLAGIDPGLFAAAVALMIVQLVIYAVRFHVMAHAAGGNMPLRQAAIANFELMFFTQAVPTQLAGDAVRVIRARRCGMSWSQGLTAVLLDRTVGVSVLMLIAPALLLFIPGWESNGGLLLTLALALGLCAAGLACLYFAGGLLKPYSHWRLIRLAIQASEGFRLLLSRPGDVWRAGLASVAGHACSGLAAVLLAAGIGISLSPWAAIPALALVQIAILLPLSIGGWGIREGAFVVVFAALGIAAADSLAISISYGLATLATGLFGGAVWFLCGYRTQTGEGQPRKQTADRQQPSD